MLLHNVYKPVQKNKHISMALKAKLYKSLFMSTMLYSM